MAATVPAHIQPPGNIELKQSSVDDKRIGAFCLDELIPKDEEFGPFKGRIVYSKNCEDVDQKFSWEVYDLETFKYLHTVDATDSSDGNWMRYVCCARYFEEQNIVSNQHGAEVYYRALKDIHPGEELLTWFQPKKKRKRSSLRESIEFGLPSETNIEQVNEGTGLGVGKRKRKPKIIPDSYQGPLDFKCSNKPKKPDDDEFEPLQPGQKRRRRKKIKSTTQEEQQPVPTSSETPSSEQEGKLSGELKIEKEQKDVKLEQSDELFEKNYVQDVDKDSKASNEIRSLKRLKSTKKEKALCLREANKLVDWKFPAKGEEYVFRLKRYHLHYLSKGKKAYKCEICLGLYKQMFSLKRHYLRNHINYKYLSKADIANCSINLKYVKQMMYERALMNQWKKKKENGEEVDESQNSFFEKLDKTVQSLSNDTQDNNEQKTLNETLEANEIQIDKDNSNLIKTLQTDNFDKETEHKSIDLKTENPVVGSEGDHSSSYLEEKVVLSNDSNDLPEENKVSSNSSNRADLSVEDIKTEIMDEDLKENAEQTLSNIKKENDFENNDIGDVSTQNCNQSQNESENPGNSCIKAEQNNGFSDEEISLSVVQDLKPEDAVDNIVRGKMPGLYRCYTCFEAFDTVEEIRKHLEDHPLQALCFACDQCNMRFHFKQNLVRHKKVHEKEITDEVKKPKMKWAKQMGDDTKIMKRLNKKKEKAEAMAEPCKIPVIEPKGTSDNVFKCNKCKQIFENQKTLTDHVQEQHKDGGKFQCQYCGKDFPSMPNMKKHVRFHLGYRVRCRTCSEIFSNVGALRKHIRLVHPEIYKAKREDKLIKEDSQTVDDKSNVEGDKGSADDKSDKLNTEQEKNHKKDSSQQISESPKEDIGTPEDILSETDLTFEAHEIDDGGSRFKYSCSICKKRFSSYINMRRHRRKVHSGNRQKLEEGLIFTRKSKNTVPPAIEDRKELEQFYTNVSHNIAINLNCYIDGKSESLEKYTDHIIVEDYENGSFGYSELNEQVTIAWEEYNFPPDFLPVSTLSVSAKQTELEDKNENHGNENQTVPDLDISESTKEKIEVFVEQNFKKHSNHIDHIDTQAENMGKPSTGIKTIASVGKSAVQKITKSLENLMSDSNQPETLVSKLPSRIFSKNSPSARNFCQVKNGEYANFDDLMLGDDFSTIARDKDEFMKDEDRPTRNRAHSSASSRMTNKKPRYKRSHSAGDLLDEEQKPEDMCLQNTSKDLYRESQAELDKLYDSIDMGVECSPEKLDTPKSLSKLCERMLGLKSDTICRKQETKNDPYNIIDNKGKPRASTQLFTNLSLSSCKEKETPVNVRQELQPDYSDASIDSPFYNYESIAFGKNGDISKVCAVCKTHFGDFDSLMNHHWKKHPLSACNYLEVEEGNDIESLHFSYPTNIGVLAESYPRLSTVSESGSFHCTRCGGVFKSKAKLHVHIVNCSPIDPVYGAVKLTSSPVKSPKKRSPTAVGQNDINIHNSSTQKRVFTGCRKRTALLLPDSPIKMTLGDKNIQDIMSGYNPNKHIRRRELTELVDTLTCEACGQKFKTIILLERHVKNCAEKEKFKNVRPLTCPILDESLAKIKNICFYCDKNFTYAKSLINHFQDFCPVKKMKVDKGDLTYEEKMREAKIITRLHKQEVDKVSKDKDTEGHCKRPWQVGRKPKRKGHSWTYIKKRKQMADNEIEAENDVHEIDSDESVVNTSIQNGQITPEKDSPNFHDANGNLMVQDKDTKISNLPIEYDEVDSLSSFTEEYMNKDKNDIKISANVERGPIGNKYLLNDQHTCSFNKTIKELDSKEEFQEDKDFTVSDRNVMNNGLIPVFETEKEQKRVFDSDEMLGNWNLDANTSLDFTKRYKVNQISVPQKETTAKALFMQCVTPSASSPTSTNGKVERSKRKRERCGKVEAFLQNVFKRKKKKEALMQAKDTENNEIIPAKVSVEDLKGKISDLGNRLTSNEILNIQNDTKLTYISTDFRHYKDEDKKITYSECFESRKEENGNIRYLFKRGRPRKHPLLGKSEKSETEIVKKEEYKKTKDKTATDDTVCLPQKSLIESKTTSEEQSIGTCTTKRPRGRPRKRVKIHWFKKKTDPSYNSESVKETKKVGADIEESLIDETKNNSIETSQIVKDEGTHQVIEDVYKNCSTIKSAVNQFNDPELLPNQILRVKEDREPLESMMSVMTYKDHQIVNEQSELPYNQIPKLNVEISSEDLSENCEYDICDKMICEAETSSLCNKSQCSSDSVYIEVAKEQNKDSATREVVEEQSPDRNTSSTELLITDAQLVSKFVSDDCNTVLEQSVTHNKLNTTAFSEMIDGNLRKDKVPSDSKQSLNTESAALSPCDSEDQVTITKEISTKFTDTSSATSNGQEETKRIAETSEILNVDTEIISLKESTCSDCMNEDTEKISNKYNTDSNVRCEDWPASTVQVETGTTEDESYAEESVTNKSAKQNEDCFDTVATENCVSVDESANAPTEKNVEMKSKISSEHHIDSCTSEHREPVSKSHLEMSVEMKLEKRTQHLVNSVATENSVSLTQKIPTHETNNTETDNNDFFPDIYSSVVLSPSERVKTNKRSCKKEPSPFSPVWVKQKTKPRTTEQVNSKNVQLTASEDGNKTTNNEYVSDIEKQIQDTANGNLKDIPKALKRKLEIVRMFDSFKNNSQK